MRSSYMIARIIGLFVVGISATVPVTRDPDRLQLLMETLDLGLAE